MIEKLDIRAFNSGMVYPPTQSYDRISAIQENKKLLTKGYNKNTTVSIKVLGNVYEDTLVESHIYSLVIKRLLALNLNQLPKFYYNNTEIITPPNFFDNYIVNYYNLLSTGYGFIYVLDKNGQIVLNNVPAESVFKGYENGNFKEYIVGEYIYSDDDIFKENSPVKVKLSHIGFEKGKLYITDVIHSYDDNKKLLGPVISTLENKSNLTDYNLIEFMNGIDGESDFEQYKRAVQSYEKALTSLNLLIEVGLAPIVEVPLGSLVPDENGNMTSPFKAGSAVENNGQTPIRTIPLDLNMTDLQEHKKQLWEDIAVQTELGSLLKASFGGSNVSGESLKIMLKSALDKSSRICDALTEPMKRLLAVILQLQGNKEVKASDITIVWKDGINNDGSEVVQ